jgi:hypothetical protein
MGPDDHPQLLFEHERLATRRAFLEVGTDRSDPDLIVDLVVEEEIEARQ